jgi:ribosomal-protein-alanine N-acetyltransferase
MKTLSAVTVRPARPEDIPIVHRMEQACFSDPWEEASIAAALSLPHMRAWVAEQGEGAGRELIGYVIGLFLGGESEVADLAVEPSARGRGVGKLLLDQLLSESQSEGAQKVFLEVRASNMAAQALYGSRGFEVVGRRKGYYRNPVEDALLLRRDFAPT